MEIGNLVLPELDCGLCGYKTCGTFKQSLVEKPEQLKRCVMLKDLRQAPPSPRDSLAACASSGCASAACSVVQLKKVARQQDQTPWVDSLGRDFDFYLEHLPEDPGPREVILPHNPQLTRELCIAVGDVMIGRPLGMSCGCPVTHCGVVTEVDPRTGVIVWCVTGPLRPRQEGYKDIGYYSAEAYEGLVKETRTELRIGARYFFQPRLCMLQWRHSGMVNFLNRTPEGLRLRLEGLWIG